MPVVTQYICDRCKTSQDTADQMWEIAITRTPYGDRRYHNIDKPYTPVMWCRECCEKVNVLGTLIWAADWVEPTKITMEDLIREMIETHTQSSD